jgi:hypothetical protein
MMEKIMLLGDSLDKIVFDKGFARVYIKSPFAFSDARYVMDYSKNLEELLGKAIELKNRLKK